MVFRSLTIAGAYLIELEPREDNRGMFARQYSEDEFISKGLNAYWPEINVSANRRIDTLRGMHFQKAPHEEVKLIRCTRGKIFDVVLDLRPDSPSFRRWYGAELSQENRSSLYVPAGCAHGYQTMLDDCEVLYLVSTRYVGGAEGGIRWDDPYFSIEWPKAMERVISSKDQSWPDFSL